MFTTFPERFSYAITLISARTRKTKKQIADEINISPSALTQLTKGISKQASESTLNSLKQKYSLNPEWLLEGKGDIFVSPDGFEELRPSITTGTDSYGGRYVSATTKGWSKILNYYYTETKSSTRLTLELAKKINGWPGVANAVRPLHGSPVFLRNYKSARDNDCDTSIYTLIVFHLEGTPPKGYIITERESNVPRNIYIDQGKRIFLACRSLLDVSFRQITMCEGYEYFVDLSHNEYLEILNKQPPKNLRLPM